MIEKTKVYIPEKFHVLADVNDDSHVSYYRKSSLCCASTLDSHREHLLSTETFKFERDFENVPTRGFKLSRHFEGSICEYFGRTKEYVRILDPRGFSFDVETYVFFWCLSTDSFKDNTLQGEYVLGWFKGKTCLIPTNSDEYRESLNHTQQVLSKKSLTKDQYIVGKIYESNKCKLCYCGKVDAYTFILRDVIEYKGSMTETKYCVCSSMSKGVTAKKIESFFENLDFCVKDFNTIESNTKPILHEVIRNDWGRKITRTVVQIPLGKFHCFNYYFSDGLYEPTTESPATMYRHFKPYLVKSTSSMVPIDCDCVDLNTVNNHLKTIQSISIFLHEVTENDLKTLRFEYDGYYSNVGDFNPRGRYGVLSFKCVNKPIV